jgi:hypothetical protein
LYETDTLELNELNKLLLLLNKPRLTKLLLNKSLKFLLKKPSPLLNKSLPLKSLPKKSLYLLMELQLLNYLELSIKSLLPRRLPLG